MQYFVITKISMQMLPFRLNLGLFRNEMPKFPVIKIFAFLLIGHIGVQ
jgi:hypothetical protein